MGRRVGRGRYVRSDRVVSLEPIEEGRGPGRRTRVCVEDVPDPMVASRSETAILRDLVDPRQDAARGAQQRQLLDDILAPSTGSIPSSGASSGTRPSGTWIAWRNGSATASTTTGKLAVGLEPTTC
jgi:hypothetical protein